MWIIISKVDHKLLYDSRIWDNKESAANFAYFFINVPYEIVEVIINTQ